MIGRRELLLGAGATASLAWSSTLGAATAVVLYDGRFNEARRFAAALARSGALSLETERNVAGLWYGRVQQIAIAYPGMPIAGLATHADFDVIGGCAAEARLKLAHHAIHDGRGGLGHRVLRGPDCAAALTRAGHAWPETLATQLCGASAVEARPAPRAGYPGTLVSWMIT